MAVDIEYLRKHYASLSDEALEDINRADLVAAAQQCLDEELKRRDLDSSRYSTPSYKTGPDGDDDDAEEFDEPDWLEDGAVVYSNTVYSASAPAPDAANAREVLEAAGIPCHMELFELPEEVDDGAPRPTHQWRVMVPGQLNLRATSVLDRDIFNLDFETEWRAHLEAFSDKELRAMSPQKVFCGLFDRIERATRAYNEEIARRKLKSE
jgi:hypothetical protein